MNFVHLHVHSHYSLLDGLTKIDELVDKAKEMGFTSLALTDHGVMYGVVEFYQKCKKAGIKPIIGVEVYLASGSRLNKNVKSDEKNYHLLLLAKNEQGYKNLIKMTTIAHLEGFYYKPRIDWEVLQKHNDGLIACSACLSGEIPKLILAGNLVKAKKRAIEYRELFGKDNFYLELQHHANNQDQILANKHIIALAKELNISLIATNDSHYLNKDDDEPQDVLLCLQTKKKKEDRDRMMMLGDDFSLLSAKDMVEAFKDTPEAITNTVKIAEKCNFELELGKIQLPYFEVPNGYDEDSYLVEKCKQGLVNRYNKTYEQVESEIKERMDYELSVIKNMGWPSYFLIVADFVNWAKEQKIVVGPGRGSAAGSIVCYLTGITNLDPLKYDLLFERFLNPDRISMPDIDMDFADIRRDEVIRYVENKYGKDHVAQIITFGTMAARAAIRDVGRVLNYPYDYCDRLAKMIPMFSKIDQALRVVAELKEAYQKEEGVRQIIDYAKRLEGVARHVSTHACGVVITKESMDNYMPRQFASSSDRSIVSQYSLHPIEDLGLLKMDFLGLKNLTIIESAIKIIKNTRGVEVDIDKIPMDDKMTYRLFQDGGTTGVFQFESSGMKRYLKELKSTEFEDIIAMVALYRPGPMEWIPDYIAGKHGKKKLTYLHPKLEPILKKTYGVAIYQEQVMQIARDLAGFTMAEADVLRKAMGKKIAELLAEQKEKFVDGCVKNSISSQLAEKIFSFIEPFAGYGFNRSHAACYALIGYQTAYLKSHWPTEFMAALLTADQQNMDRVAIEIEECRNMDINVLPPNINQSFSSFTVITSGTEKNQVIDKSETPTTIRFGLKAIKNIGDHIAEEIIRERKENGPYQDIGDFLERVQDKDLNKKSLESLIKCGGLDMFGDRGELLGNMDNLLNYNREITQSKNSGQTSLFASAPNLSANNKIKLEKSPPATQSETLAWEKELLGLYITEHPLTDYKPFLSEKILSISNLAQHIKDYQVNVVGVVTKIQKIITRSSEAMLFVKIEDLSGSLEILVFPSLLKEIPSVWQEGKIIVCRGKLSDKDRDIKLLCNNATELNIDKAGEIISKFVNNTNGFNKNGNNGNFGYKRFNSVPVNMSEREAVKNITWEGNDLHIKISDKISNEAMSKLKKLLEENPGSAKVYFEIKTANSQTNTIETELGVSGQKTLIDSIERLIRQNV